MIRIWYRLPAALRCFTRLYSLWVNYSSTLNTLYATVQTLLWNLHAYVIIQPVLEAALWILHTALTWTVEGYCQFSIPNSVIAILTDRLTVWIGRWCDFWVFASKTLSCSVDKCSLQWYPRQIGLSCQDRLVSHVKTDWFLMVVLFPSHSPPSAQPCRSVEQVIGSLNITFHWPQADHMEIASLQCPCDAFPELTKDAFASRMCGAGGQWLEANVEACTFDKRDTFCKVCT